MDGAAAINRAELVGGRSKLELSTLAERAAKRWAEQLASDLHVQSIATERRWRGLPVRCAAWPEFLWECWCESTDSYGFSESDVLAMREPFLAEAAMRLDDAGFDCR
jgi:hypothetical protein